MGDMGVSKSWAWQESPVLTFKYLLKAELPQGIMGSLHATQDRYEWGPTQNCNLFRTLRKVSAVSTGN